ncbi:MAG: hypothetical protein ACYC3Q_12405 [Gemmatimonadaceae bacterium]
MTSIKVRLVVIAAACLALTGAIVPGSSASRATTTTTTTGGTNRTDQGHQGAEVLITNAGYMVAVG